jgi:hypothetical protein
MTPAIDKMLEEVLEASQAPIFVERMRGVVETIRADIESHRNDPKRLLLLQLITARFRVHVTELDHLVASLESEFPKGD